jgi:mannan endo-1,4-beta-mannosidase
MTNRIPRFLLAGVLLCAASLFGCSAAMQAPPPPAAPRLVDANATVETRALFVNLQRLAPEALLFGHQNTLAYGYGWTLEPGRSDVKETAGSFPAVYGWDANELFPRGPQDRGAAARTQRLRDWIREGYGRGGVVTMSWHMYNPVTERNFYDTTRAVYAILPGGTHHEAYRAKLDTLADFFQSLAVRDASGREHLVPVVFRPFHEMSGHWFWWGARHATREEFVDLWRFTVEYLRDQRRVHNLLWAFSPDVFDSKLDFLDRYPGDEYVDVLGYDDYHSVLTPATRDVFVRRLRDLVELAESRGKLAALTETGVEAIPDPTWWTQTLLAGIRSDPVAQRIAWVLVWRNANPANDRPDHFYAPYPGHPSVPDFVRFREDPFTLFEDDLPEMYRAGNGWRRPTGGPLHEPQASPTPGSHP